MYSSWISGLLLASLCQIPSTAIIISGNHLAPYLEHKDLREVRNSDCKSVTQLTSLITHVRDVWYTKYGEIKKETSNPIKMKFVFWFCFYFFVFFFFFPLWGEKK